MSHVIFEIYWNYYSLFIWNSNLIKHRVFLFAKSGNPNYNITQLQKIKPHDIYLLLLWIDPSIICCKLIILYITIKIQLHNTGSFPGGSDSKESACNVGDPVSIPRSGRSPGEGNGNPLQYSCLENPMDRGAWQAAVHGVSKSWDTIEWLTLEKAMAPHFSTLAWKILWMEEPGGLQSMGSLRVRHDWVTSRSLFTFMHWRRKWQPTPVFLPRESQGQGSMVGCRLWGCTEPDTTEVT